ncbi:N-acetyltransferase [Alginatibacterium sediminis]|uniref:N-acetyltransferase n=1 Tax=Alginatibacterium sediminis TaxID=2164068 RepID=A0A420EBN6_9ALTE|nr:GNAT family N-acetyltransferase [Alginatibacterium sediminis]RKF18052.1 N-acetyltransferase [Alginatibacterium sediminis]
MNCQSTRPIAIKLIQVSEAQFAQLDASATMFSSYRVHQEALPPAHVLARASKLVEQGAAARWAYPYLIVTDTHVVGSCGFKGPAQSGQLEIGYNVAPDARGRGVASAAVNLLTGLAFSSGEVSAVVALIAPENKASLHVIANNNFHYQNDVIDSDGEALQCWQLKRSPTGVC